MRTIKFRTIYKRENSIVIKHYIIGASDEEKLSGSEWINAGFKIIDRNLSTELYDKNGKEIYEGDVAMYEDTESDFVDVGIGDVKVSEQQVNSFAEVKFENGCFGIDIKQGELFQYQKGFHSFEWWNENMENTSNLEIIGNIYENPELLK